MRKVRTLIVGFTFLTASIGFSPAISAQPTASPKFVKAMQNPTNRRLFAQWVHGLALRRWLEAIEANAASACGGDLPPCYVMMRESHGNIYAVNPGHQGAPYGDPGDPWTHASGKWQFMPGTWNHYKGYPYAAAAPATVQNDKAREVWAGGAGASHWACC